MKMNNQIVEMMNQAKKAPCILCGKPSVHVALFIPKSPQSYGAKPGVSRVIAYGLCNACFNTADGMDRAEQFMMILSPMLPHAHHLDPWPRGPTHVP